ncbi:MAG: type IV pilin protein [Gammaproteobacteria bacterium]
MNANRRPADHRRQAGFTLMELMIVVVIVGILAAIGYPSYRNQAIRAARSDARTELMDAMTRQEQFFLDNKTYAASLANLDMVAASESGYYTLSIDAATAACPITSCYAMRATPTGSQTEDTDCAVLTVTSGGIRSATGTDPASCW